MNRHHPDRIWFKSYTLEGVLHFKVTDCEFGEGPEEAHITHLIFNRKNGTWTGWLQQGSQRFLLSQRQAEILFQGFFNIWS